MRTMSCRQRFESMTPLITAKKPLFSQCAPARRTQKCWTHMVKVWRRHWLWPRLGLCHHLVAQQRGHKGQRIPNAEQGGGVEVHHQALRGGHPQMSAAARQDQFRGIGKAAADSADSQHVVPQPLQQVLANLAT